MFTVITFNTALNQRLLMSRMMKFIVRRQRDRVRPQSKFGGPRAWAHNGIVMKMKNRKWTLDSCKTL